MKNNDRVDPIGSYRKLHEVNTVKYGYRAPRYEYIHTRISRVSGNLHLRINLTTLRS